MTNFKSNFHLRLFLSYILLGGVIASLNMGELYIYPMVFVVVGWTQYYIVQLMHESIHQVFNRRPDAYSRFIGYLVCYPVGLSRNYYYLHLDHHKFFGDPEKDPDYSLYMDKPSSKINFINKLIYYFSGIAVVAQLMDRSKKPTLNSKFKAEGLHFLICQAFIFSFFTFVTSWYFYFIFWLAPIVTIVKGLSYLRTLAEHGSITQEHAIRTFKNFGYLSHLLGPIGFMEHGLHHQKMMIPFTELKEKINEIDLDHQVIEGNHLTVLKNMWKEV